MRKLILHSFMCAGIVFFMSAACFGQDQDNAETGKLKSQKGLSKAEVKAKFDKSMADKGANAAKKMSESIQSKGFKAENAYYGDEATFEKDGKTITSSLIMQDYSKGNSKAAVGIVTVSDGTNTESYTFSLEKKGKEPTDVEEFYVNEKGEVVKANSWFSCLRNYIYKRCGSLTAFYSCWYAGKSWTSLLYCIKAISCGSSAGVKAVACCSCDCSWVCKWAVGCCDR